MKVSPIANPLPGERVVAVFPPLGVQVDAKWHRRLNLYTGRTLSDNALTLEQMGRAGRLVTLAQVLSPGVVHGLEIDLENGPETAKQRLHIAAGRGISVLGEDVFIPRAVRVDVDDLIPSVARIEGTFGILVLQPVTVRRAGRFDPDDPCDVDETEAAFADEQDIDACQLVFLSWVDAELPDGEDATFRNRVAYHIFRLDELLPFGQAQSWALSGVPLAALGFGAGGAVAWVDRYSVVRAGGRAKARTPLVAGAGTPFLWQARLQQMADQLTDQRATPIGERIVAYDRLPPAGILPRDAVDLVARTSAFFPPHWAVRAVPLPIEQLDDVIARGAPLAPLVTGLGERVILIVPVPQSVYEPGLLVEEELSPVFDQRIAQFVKERDVARAVRKSVRGDYRALVRALDGLAKVPQYSDFDAGTPADPDALPDEAPVEAVENPLDQGGRFGVTDGPAFADLKVLALIDLQKQLTHMDGKGVVHPVFSTNELSALTFGLADFVALMRDKLQRADDMLDLSFLKSHPNIYRIRQQLLGSTAATRLATSPVLASVARGDSAQAVTEDVNRFFLALKGRMPPGTATQVALAAQATVAKAAPAFEVEGAAPAPRAAARERVSPAEAIAAPVVSLAGGEALRNIGTLSTLARLGRGGFELDEPQLVRRDPVVVPKPPTRETVQFAAPVAGDGAYDFRTVSIAQRIEDPPAKEAKAYAVAARAEALDALAVLHALEMNVDDIPVFGVPQFNDKDEPLFQPTGLVKRAMVRFKVIKAEGTAKRVLRDPAPVDPDEAMFFSEAVLVIEHTVATLRAIEGLVGAYRVDLATCEKVLRELSETRERAASRLGGLDGQISEARHKVASARGLRADEVQRLSAVNERRAAVLREHVPFLAYSRPHFVDPRVGTPVIHLNPGQFAPPVPACLAAHDEVPSEIEEMVQLLRESPVAWFTHVPQLLEKLDRVELLHGTLEVAKARAARLRASNLVPGRFVAPNAVGRFGPAIARATELQQSVVAQYRLQVAVLDLARFAGRGWRDTREEAVGILSLGDLIESNHGRSVVTDAAAAELRQITRVAGCFHAQVSQVLPVIRLEWAERLSRVDAGVDLRNLTVLPRWGELDFVFRRELQALADWLYGRIAPNQPNGVAWMHDLLRVCVLLASHSPVNQVIAGLVAASTQATPGRTVPIAIDPTKIRLGMKVLFYRRDQVVAHGVVEDLIGGQARARIAESLVKNATLDSGTRAQFVRADALELPTFGKKLL
jgi:hypothetical protein